MSRFHNSWSSTFKFSIFHALSFNLLSNILNFLICSSVKFSALTHGISFNHNFWLASYLPCPAMITLFLSMTTGCKNPNSLIEFAMRLTCVSSWILLLNSYGIRFSIFTISIFMFYILNNKINKIKNNINAQHQICPLMSSIVSRVFFSMSFFINKLKRTQVQEQKAQAKIWIMQFQILQRKWSQGSQEWLSKIV